MSSRRSFLRGAALAGVALPFVQLIDRTIGPGATALGQSMPTTPKRAVFIMVNNGIEDWNNDVGTPGATPAGFNLGAHLTPLQPYKDQLVVLDGVDMRHDGIGGDTHMQGEVLWLTGNHFRQTTCGPHECTAATAGVRNQSVDQYLATRVGRVATPRIPSLELGVQADGVSDGPSFDSMLNPVQRDNNPAHVWDRLFAGGTTAPDPAAVLRRTLRHSVLDNVVGDLGDLRTRLGSEDRMRLDAHLASIRNIETQLTDAPLAASCVPPATPTGSQRGMDLNNAANVPTISRMQLDNLVAAFQCDLTRVASLHFRSVYSHQNFPFGPVNESDFLHDLSHSAFDGGASNTRFQACKRWFFSEIAYLVNRLKSIDEGDGHTLLDNTLIFVGSEIAQGHTHVRMPFFVLGGSNMGVNTGRYMHFTSGTPHTRLLVSILNAMGVADSSFGDTTYGTGPLPGLLR